MKLGKETIAMCRLVSFVEKEREIATAVGLIPETYAEDVLKRFQKEICPDAVLIMGHREIGMKIFDFVRCGIDGEWEFSVSKPDLLMVTVKTDGSIHLDEGAAEVIFNFVND